MFRSTRVGRARLLAGLTWMGVILTAAPAAAEVREEALEPEAPVEWALESSPFADLWYHGLAAVGFHGFGPHPLYNVAYGRRAARENPGGALAREAEELRREMESDPAFELLHFVPVYLSGLTSEQALAGLHRVAESRAASAESPGSMALALVAALLPGEEQRAVLGRFVRALELERGEGLEARLAEDRARRERLLVDLQLRWTTHFMPALAPYLEGHGLSAGRIIVTPALGLEGRFFQGDLRQVQDNVVIVGLDPAQMDPDAVLAPAVRELCYPAVREAFEAVQSRYDDRVAASRASDAAATRCGELLLERLLPGAAEAYRSRFGLQGPRPSAWSSLPDPAEGLAWDAALGRVLNLSGGS